MSGELYKQPDSSEFWAWLAQNAARIQAAGRRAGGIAGEVSRAFKASYPDLVWEITPSLSDPWIFAVSADGNFDLFGQVTAAVAAAPPISGWEIKAFRQRGSLNAVIEIQGRSVGYEDVWCLVEPDGSRVRVTLLVRGITADSAEALLDAALVLLDNAVGEYDSMVKISELDNGPLPARPERSGTFFPLSELPEYLDHLPDPAPGGHYTTGG